MAVDVQREYLGVHGRRIVRRPGQDHAGLGEDVTCTITNNDQVPSLTLVKQVVNDNGGSAVASNFTLTASGPTSISGPGGVSSGASFSAGTYALSETAVPGYTAGSWSCTGTGTQNGASITLGLAQSATCTITNNDEPATLIVKKVVVNDNGGTKQAQNFSFQVNGGLAQAFQADGQNDLTVDAGTYNVVEPAVAGYAMTYDNCSGVVIAPGGTATCTVTNNDIPATLIVKKVVVNDDGGTATADDFSFQVNGGSAIAFEADGQNDLTVGAGTYNVVEPAVAGYTTTYQGCSNIVIPLAGTATCTITNNDQAATLTVIKTVVNDNGGTAAASAFTMTINGVIASGGNSFPGAAAGVTRSITTFGSYGVTESSVPGYTQTSASADCAGTIALGQHKTCTITNDDVAPKLTLVKVVVNDNGGAQQPSAWTWLPRVRPASTAQGPRSRAALASTPAPTTCPRPARPATTPRPGSARKGRPTVTPSRSGSGTTSPARSRMTTSHRP